MINLDPFSILVTVLYVAILYLFMNRFFFGPISRILGERRSLIAGRLEEAQKRMIEVDQMTSEYETAIRAARAEGYRKQEISREEALATKAALVTQARVEAEKALQTTKGKLLEEASAARQRLESDVDRLAEDLSAALLRD